MNKTRVQNCEVRAVLQSCDVLMFSCVYWYNTLRDKCGKWKVRFIWQKLQTSYSFRPFCIGCNICHLFNKFDIESCKSVIHSDSFLNPCTIMAYKRGWVNEPDKCGFWSSWRICARNQGIHEYSRRSPVYEFLSTFHFWLWTSSTVSAPLNHRVHGKPSSHNFHRPHILTFFMLHKMGET